MLTITSFKHCSERYSKKKDTDTAYKIKKIMTYRLISNYWGNLRKNRENIRTSSVQGSLAGYKMILKSK